MSENCPCPARARQVSHQWDGAMVPLVGGEWAEVKTLVIGEVEQRIQPNGKLETHMHNISYFSHLTDSGTFQRLALVETHRRGVEMAGRVGAVADGSKWIQTFTDFHQPDTAHILDFPHAGEHIGQAGQSVLGEGTPVTRAWLDKQLHRLRHNGPGPVLNEIRQLVEAHPTREALQNHLAYLEKREAQMQYPTFRAEGWPIASGSTESGNKLVVEARLKGNGMHWARPHVDPMLALRNIVCSDRWDEAWPQIVLALRQQDWQRRSERRQKRRAQCTAMPQPVVDSPIILSDPQPLDCAASPTAPVDQGLPANEPAQTKPAGPWRPPANHPWRHMPIGRARFKPPAKHTNPKT